MRRVYDGGRSSSSPSWSLYVPVRLICSNVSREKQAQPRHRPFLGYYECVKSRGRTRCVAPFAVDRFSSDGRGACPFLSVPSGRLLEVAGMPECWPIRGTASCDCRNRGRDSSCLIDEDWKWLNSFWYYLGISAQPLNVCTTVRLGWVSIDFEIYWIIYWIISLQFISFIDTIHNLDWS